MEWSPNLPVPLENTSSSNFSTILTKKKNGGRCNQNFSLFNVHTVMEWSLETKFLILLIYLVSDLFPSCVSYVLSDRCCIYAFTLNDTYILWRLKYICFLLIYNVSAFNYFNWHFPNWKFGNNRKQKWRVFLKLTPFISFYIKLRVCLKI